MSTKCARPSNMKFGMGQAPSSVTIDDHPVQLHAYGLPDGVSIEIVKCEDDKINDPPCYGYSAPAIDPCTGEQAALSAENPTAVLNAEGTYKMEVVGAAVEDVWNTAAVFCYELSGDVSLLLKKADEAGLSPADVKALIEACIAPLTERVDALEDSVPVSVSVDADAGTASLTTADGTVLPGTYVPLTLPEDVHVVAGDYAITGACQVVLNLTDGSTANIDLCDVVSEVDQTTNPDGSVTVTHTAGGVSQAWTLPAPRPVTTSYTVASQGTLAIPDPVLEGECAEVTVNTGSYQSLGSAAEITGRFSGSYRVSDAPGTRTEIRYGNHTSNWLRPWEPFKLVADANLRWQVVGQMVNQRHGTRYQEFSSGYYSAWTSTGGAAAGNPDAEVTAMFQITPANVSGYYATTSSAQSASNFPSGQNAHLGPRSGNTVVVRRYAGGPSGSVTIDASQIIRAA